ncbi:dienelactone hydrolase family protein [Microbispora hainanensis]|uniref:Dienelactone hydrolase family protein n=1 Tax=Microbispora hainanensis TaxID=568844 RepID=A0A544YA20_9ACTN|nr:dienelactone hydrolase family protein [Microbispora hainanensis]TQS13613.1 dienelactone hydrolase family protein [Microbispora hainanensis]
MTHAMWAGTVAVTGHEGAELEAYAARPLDSGPHGGVVVIHHMPGYDEATKEIVRKFAAHGYAAVCPNLYSREGAGVSPDDQAAAARAKGGVPDEQLVGDVAGAAAYLKGLEHANGKVGVIGYCSGGRQTFLAACSLQIDAAVDCYGAFVVTPPPAEFSLKAAPLISLAGKLSCPLLGLFGADDTHPSPEEVGVLSAELDKLGKEHKFQIFPDAGHGFFATDRSSYRPAAAVEGWKKVFGFFGRHLTA